MMRSLWMLWAGMMLVGCAEPPFSVHAQDNDLKTLQPTLQRIQPVPPQPRNGSGHAMVYIFAGPERRPGGMDREGGAAEKTLYGYDLTAEKLAFAVPADVHSRFVLSRGMLVHREGTSDLALRDAQTGALRGKVALLPGETLIGIAADDDQIYYVTHGKSGDERQSYVTALLHSGQRAWRIAAPGSVGAPAAQSGLLALPFRYQDVVVLDAKRGAELTRIRQKDEQIGFVRADPLGLFYGIGDRGAALLTEQSIKGQKDQIAYLSPNLGDKVRVFLHWDGYRAEQVDFSAFDRNRLLWDAQRSGDKLAFRDNQVVLHSYRFFFSVEAQSGRIQWAYAQPRQNVMASDLNQDAVLYVTQDGEVGALLRRSGAKVYLQRLQLGPGQQVIGATFDAAGFAPRDDSAKAPPVLDVLHGVIFDKDSSFLSVKTFAVQEINTIPGKEATAALLRVVTAEGMPAQISRAAGEALVARRDREVAGMLVEALKQSYDYLDDRRPKGVGILARAAAAMGAQEAVPALAQRLLDASTPPSALKDIVAALVQLGGKEAVPSLRELLLLYRSDPAFAADAEALKLAGEGMLKLGGMGERSTIQFVTLAPHTIAPLATHFSKLLNETASSRKVSAATPLGEGGAKGK